MAASSGSGVAGCSVCCVICSRLIQIKSQIVCAAFEFVYITTHRHSIHTMNTSPYINHYTSNSRQAKISIGR